MPDSPTDHSSGGNKSTVNKLAKLVDEYDLGAAATALEQGWDATGEKHRSLRDLEREFNKRLVEYHLKENGQQPLKGEIETFYSLLCDEDVSEGDRIRAKRRLEEQGVNVEQLTDDFVSYQTIRRYLQQYRDITYSEDESDRLETATKNLQRLSGRVATITESKLKSLKRSGDISLGPFRVVINTYVYCEDCHTRYSVGELLEAGTCECGSG